MKRIREHNQTYKMTSKATKHKQSECGSLPVHLLEMVALTHHKAWFRLCCVSREFGCFSLAESEKLRASLQFSTMTLETIRCGEYKRCVFTSEGRVFTNNFDIGTQISQCEVYNISLPSSMLHCARQPASVHCETNARGIIKWISTWLRFGEKHAPTNTPAVCTEIGRNTGEGDYLVFSAREKEEEFWRMGEKHEHPTRGHSVKTILHGLAQSRTILYNPPPQEEGKWKIEERVYKVRDGKEYLAKESFYMWKDGSYSVGRPEECGPSVLKYTRSGFLLKMYYLRGGLHRVDAPAVLISKISEDGEESEPFAEFFFLRDTPVEKKGKKYRWWIRFGDGGKYTAYVGDRANYMDDGSPNTIIVDSEGRTIAEFWFKNAQLAEYDFLYPKDKIRPPSFVYTRQGEHGFKCNFHSGEYNSEVGINKILLDQSRHTSGECNCEPFYCLHHIFTLYPRYLVRKINKILHLHSSFDDVAGITL